MEPFFSVFCAKSYISEAMSIKEPDQSVWDRFWARKQDLSKVYPASPAIRKTIHKYFPNVQGLKILEVGPGTG